MTHRRRTILRYIAVCYLVAVAAGGWGLAIGRYKVFPFTHIQLAYRQISTFVAGRPENEEQGVIDRLILHRQQQRNKYSYIGLRRHDTEFLDPGLLLLSRFSSEHKQVIVELVRAQDFTPIHTWVPPVEELLEHAPRDLMFNSVQGYCAKHPLLLSDGAIVFHSGEGPLVKLNRNSRVDWVNNEHFHHSIEFARDGALVIPIVNSSPLQSLPADYRDDGYAVVTLDGKIVERYSASKILMDNGYRSLLLGVGEFEYDRIHLNDAQPVYENVGTAQVGDVVLSLRNLSTVLLYRPRNNRIMWLKTGPWLNQHDVNMLEDGSWSIFGNDVCRLPRDELELANERSEVYVYDPQSDIVTTPYTDIFASAEMISRAEGRSKILPNGDIYVEETNFNRLLRVSPTQVRWEYVNGNRPRVSGALHWCRYLSPHEIAVLPPEWR